MSQEQEPNVVNYAAIKGDGKHPEIYCPVCGKNTIQTDERCSHILFYFEDSFLDGISFGYIDPKLKAAVKALKEKQIGYLSEGESDDLDDGAWDRFQENKPDRLGARDLASALNLNPDSTLVTCVTNMFSSVSACSNVVDAVVGIEFPPGSAELKAYKRLSGRGFGHASHETSGGEGSGNLPSLQGNVEIPSLGGRCHEAPRGQNRHCHHRGNPD